MDRPQVISVVSLDIYTMSAFLYFFQSFHLRIGLFSKYSFHFPFRLSPVAFSIIFFLLVPDTTFAQQNFQWRNFTRFGDNHLISNNVRTITEDRSGQIWLGTDRGLNRLDGFWHEAGRSNGGPQSADVFKVFEDSAGFIWVATEAGVYRGVWDNSRGQVDWLQHYTQGTGLIGIGEHVVTMIQRQNGEIWVGTPLGVNWFDGSVWHSVDSAEVEQLNQGVQIIYEDKAGALWFGLSQSNRLQSGNLISRFNNVGWEIFSVNDGLPNGDVQAILEDRFGNLWIGTTAGAAVYDGSAWHVVTAEDGLLIGSNVQAIMSDGEGTIWIGTTAGISQFYPLAQFSPTALRDLGRWRHLTRANGLASNNIQALFETRTGEIWVGTRDNGANFSDRSWTSITMDDGLSHNSVTAMLKDRRGRLWIGTRSGLSYYTQNRIELVTETPGNEVRALAEDLRDRIWVGTNAGIGIFDGVSWEVFRIPDINVNSVQSIITDSVGDVWAATGFLPTDDLPGLDRYDGQQWERNQFLEIDRTIVVMFIDSQGRLYFGTVGNEEGGSDLWVYDGRNLHNFYSLPKPFSIHTILEVPSGEIWVGTDTGIQIFDKQTLNLTVSLTTTDRLADNRVQALYRDGDNRIWIGTADGVSLFQNGRFERTLTASDGLNSNNISAIAEVDGLLWFGSRDNGGLSIFSPEKAPPRTRITDDSPQNGEIVGETSVVFKFEGGDASTPTGELRYLYQLDDGPLIPTDDEGEDKRAVLSGLTEGPHRFAVYAIDREGNRDLTGASREFVVDSLAPIVSITAPQENAVIGDVYEIRGTATDETDFLDYQIRIFPGDSTSGESLPPFVSTVPVEGDTLYRWDTRTVAAGLYTIELVARDTPNGDYDREHFADTSVTVEVDRLRPQVEILSPAENDQVRQRIEIRGTADDENFKEYIIEYGAGESPDTWLPISKPPTFSNPVTRNILALWDAPNLSGLHTLRLVVEDTAGHREVDQVRIFFNPSVNRETGGIVESHDKRAKITFPPNSLPRTTVVTINPVAGQPLLPVSPIPFQAYNFAPEDLGLHRLKPATIQFSAEDIAMLSRSKTKETLTIARWDGKTWLPIGGTIDVQRRTISTAVSTLGQYAVATRPAVETEENTIISDLTCQPRVFSPSRESTWISFRLNRPDDITIKIYNEAGRLRRLLRESEPLSVGGHVFEWDGHDNENRRVVSNFYFVTVEGEGALRTKVVVVQND